MSFSLSSSRTTSKPSGLKPPSYGSNSSLSKYSSTRSQESSSDSHKENESPARRGVTKRISPQKSASPSVKNKVREIHAFPPSVPIGKITSTESYDGSSITSGGFISRTASDHSRFDVESVLSIETKSTDGGGSFRSSRSVITAGGAKIVRPPNAQSRFDVTLTKSSSNSSLPKPPAALKPPSTARSLSASRSELKSGSFDISKPSTANALLSSTHSSPATKSMHPANNSIFNSPSRDNSSSLAPKPRFSPAKDNSSFTNKQSPSNDRRRPLSAQHSPSQPKEIPAESMASLMHQISDVLIDLNKYFESEVREMVRNNNYIDLFSKENDSRIIKWREENQTIGGLDIPTFIKYANGEDVVEDILTEVEEVYEGKLIFDDPPESDQY